VEMSRRRLLSHSRKLFLTFAPLTGEILSGPLKGLSSPISFHPNELCVSTCLSVCLSLYVCLSACQFVTKAGIFLKLMFSANGLVFLRKEKSFEVT